MVLLDEPFSSLDVEVRLRVRNELSRVLKTCSASGILVTHDPQEALGICDRVAIMRDGLIHQCSHPLEILTKPETPFIGNFVLQHNLIKISSNNGSYITPFGKIVVKSNLIKGAPDTLMVDENSIVIISSSSGKGIIKGKEFNNTCWVFRIEYCELIIRVSSPLDSELSIGDHCELKFISGKYGYLFPGCITCLLK